MRTMEWYNMKQDIQDASIYGIRKNIDQLFLFWFSQCIHKNIYIIIFVLSIVIYSYICDKRN